MKKKATAIRLQIPEPCTQDFSKMHPLPGGHFCDHCERTVVDFREMTDREIVRIYQQRQGRVCGTFKRGQLDRSLPLPQPPKEGRPWAAIAALTTALLIGDPAEAQSNPAPNYSQVVDRQGNENAKSLSSTKTGTTTIKGWVMDENDEPLAFATVATADGSGTTTELDGSFKLKIGNHLLGSPLTASFTGYESKSMILVQGMENEPLEIRLKAGLLLTEVVISANRTSFSSGIKGFLIKIAPP